MCVVGGGPGYDIIRDAQYGLKRCSPMLYPEGSFEALAVQAAKRNESKGRRAWQQHEPVVFEPPVRQR